MYRNSPQISISPIGAILPISVTNSPEFPTPVLIRALGVRATKAFWEFFTATLSNNNTRQAYYRAVSQFFGWLEQQGFGFLDLEPVIVAAYIEQLKKHYSVPTVKQHLAAIRQCLDYFVVNQVIRSNPSSSVRGPKYSIQQGKTSVLSAKEARRLLDSIDATSLIGLRDRALIGTLIYTFARVSAVTALRVGDYFEEAGEKFLRLNEKGGKEHLLPVHPTLQKYLDSYQNQAALLGQSNDVLFPTTAGKSGELNSNRMSRQDAFRMIQRRASNAGLVLKIGCHTFRATGITNYLSNGGTLDKAQIIANHASAKTTKLYDRTQQILTVKELRKVIL